VQGVATTLKRTLLTMRCLRYPPGALTLFTETTVWVEEYMISCNNSIWHFSPAWTIHSQFNSKCKCKIHLPAQNHMLWSPQKRADLGGLLYRWWVYMWSGSCPLLEIRPPETLRFYLFLIPEGSWQNWHRKGRGRARENEYECDHHLFSPNWFSHEYL
jgi:hypothetical protein